MQQHPVHTSNDWRARRKEPGTAESVNVSNTSWSKANSSDKSAPCTADVNDPSVAPSSDEDNTKAISEGRRIYVGNLVYHATPEDVKSHIIKAGYTVERIDMSMDFFTGRNPSYCFVEFASKEQADGAIASLTGTNLLGRVVKANSCVPRSRKRPKSTPLLDRWTRPEAEEHWRGIGREKRRLFVTGLPKPATQFQAEKLIQDLFSGFEVQAVSKVKSPPGSKTSGTRLQNHYFAFVDFATTEEAEAARKAVNGKIIAGGRVMVKYPNNDSRHWIEERDEALWLMQTEEEEKEEESSGAPLPPQE